jgi:hypothetical protein
MTPAEAAAFVENLYVNNSRRWQQRVDQGTSTRQLEAGPLGETYAAFTNEYLFGQWCAICYRALTTHYGCSRDQAVYFAKHYEAVLSEHDEGVMAHASFNKAVLARLLETGQAWERPTYGLGYCVYTATDLHANMLRASIAEYELLLAEGERGVET